MCDQFPPAQIDTAPSSGCPAWATLLGRDLLQYFFFAHLRSIPKATSLLARAAETFSWPVTQTETLGSHGHPEICGNPCIRGLD